MTGLSKSGRFFLLYVVLNKYLRFPKIKVQTTIFKSDILTVCLIQERIFKLRTCTFAFLPYIPQILGRLRVIISVVKWLQYETVSVSGRSLATLQIKDIVYGY